MRKLLLRYRPDWFDPALLAAAFSGLLLAATFPPLGQGWLGFVALIPLLLTAERRPFASGFVCGLFFFAPLLYWLNIVMTSYGGLAPFFSVVAWLLLCLYLALFFGASLWLTFALKQQLKLQPFLSLPFIWVAFEYLRGILLTGFPWGLVGYAAIDMSQLRQVADLFGVYGLSWLFVLCNSTLALLLRRRLARIAIFGLALSTFFLLSAFYYGQQALRPNADELPRMKLGLIQGNIEQNHKWDRNYRQQTLDAYRRLSLEAAAQGAELLIWPEAATPFYMQDDTVDSRQVLQIPRDTGRSLLLGGPSYQQHADQGYSYHNSAFLLGADARLSGRSDKIHLVPFGEYVPLGKLLFFVNKLVSGVGDFTPGTVKPLAMNGHDLGVLICYEAIFPELARDYVRNGSDLLVNLTNDAWFGRSSAPRQLLDMTRMRAVENRIWIARAANTGISALIAPDGRAYHETALFEPAAVIGSVELGSRYSLYRQLGDILPAICLLLTAGGLLLWYIRRKKS
jgi:apolipoprotein N-acyltransferase